MPPPRRSPVPWFPSACPDTVPTQRSVPSPPCSANCRAWGSDETPVDHTASWLPGQETPRRALRHVRIQVVAHQSDLDRLGIMDLQQFLDAAGPLDLATLVRHPHMTPTTQRLEEQEEIAR